MIQDVPFPVLQLAFTALYGTFFSAILRRADLWSPFTPTFTAAPRQWGSWQDAFRFALSGIFLLLLPTLFFIYVQLVLSSRAEVLTVTLPPTLSDLSKIITVLSFVFPQLGFYNAWQAIVRSRPTLFYSDVAIRKLEDLYPNAFKAGRANTMASALVWIVIPTLALLALFYS